MSEADGGLSRAAVCAASSAACRASSTGSRLKKSRALAAPGAEAQRATRQDTFGSGRVEKLGLASLPAGGAKRRENEKEKKNSGSFEEENPGRRHARGLDHDAAPRRSAAFVSDIDVHFAF